MKVQLKPLKSNDGFPLSYLTKCLPQGGAKASGNVMPTDQTEIAIFTFRTIYKFFELLPLVQHGYFWLTHRNVKHTWNIKIITAFPPKLSYVYYVK